MAKFTGYNAPTQVADSVGGGGASAAAFGGGVSSLGSQLSQVADNEQAQKQAQQARDASRLYQEKKAAENRAYQEAKTEAGREFNETRYRERKAEAAEERAVAEAAAQKARDQASAGRLAASAQLTNLDREWNVEQLRMQGEYQASGSIDTMYEANVAQAREKHYAGFRAGLSLDQQVHLDGRFVSGDRASFTNSATTQDTHTFNVTKENLKIVADGIGDQVFSGVVNIPEGLAMLEEELTNSGQPIAEQERVLAARTETYKTRRLNGLYDAPNLAQRAIIEREFKNREIWSADEEEEFKAKIVAQQKNRMAEHQTDLYLQAAAALPGVFAGVVDRSINSDGLEQYRDQMDVEVYKELQRDIVGRDIPFRDVPAQIEAERQYIESVLAFNIKVKRAGGVTVDAGLQEVILQQAALMQGRRDGFFTDGFVKRQMRELDIARRHLAQNVGSGWFSKDSNYASAFKQVRGISTLHPTVEREWENEFSARLFEKEADLPDGDELGLEETLNLSREVLEEARAKVAGTDIDQTPPHVIIKGGEAFTTFGDTEYKRTSKVQDGSQMYNFPDHPTAPNTWYTWDGAAYNIVSNN